MNRPKITYSAAMKLHKRIRDTVAILLDAGYYVTVAEPPTRSKYAQIMMRVEAGELVESAEKLHALIPTFPDGPWSVDAHYHPHDKVALLVLLGMSPPESELPAEPAPA